MRTRGHLAPVSAALLLATGTGCNQIIDLEPGTPETSSAAVGAAVSGFVNGPTPGIIVDDLLRQWQASPTAPTAPATGWSWYEAQSVCDAFGSSVGSTGFRVPDRCELWSVTDPDKVPAINGAFQLVQPARYWTSTCDPADPNNQAKVVDFGSPVALEIQKKSSPALVLCVNTGSTPGACGACP